MSRTDEPIDLKALQLKWYARLKKEGFIDIEDTASKQNYLKSWHSSYFHARYTPQSFELKKEYYRKAGLFLHDHRFNSIEQKQIWKLHSEGLSYREIAEILRTRKNKINKDKIQKIIFTLTEIMLSIDTYD